jgi:quinohemoprotein ethanol dehydrogenase
VAPSGSLIAYSADKGEKLYEIETGLSAGMGPPITFLVDGKQYIALMGGNGGMLSPGVNGSSRPSAQKPMLLVFGLDGKAELPKQTSGPAPLPTDPH